MEFQQLINDGELAARLAAGIKSRVVILLPFDNYSAGHFEITGITSLGDTIVLVAGDEAVAPIDPVEKEADAVDQAYEEHRDDPAFLRTTEDQPEQL